MSKRRRTNAGFWIVQAIFVLMCGLSFARAAVGPVPLTPPAPLGRSASQPVVAIERDVPLRVKPLYNDEQLISDTELAAVLRQVQPRFAAKHLKPNYVEHALRIWGVDATFRDPGVLSGVQLRDVLVDHARYLASWGNDVEPLLIETAGGVAIRWGSQEGASVHHDHWLACLTEAGVNLHEPVFTPNQHTKTINDALQQALRDFRLDEREFEWSALAFGLWLPPVKSWQTADGRTVSFDMLAQRLLRGHMRVGVCHGTHRLYSMMVLVRLDDEFRILSPDVRNQILTHLKHVRQLLIDSQFADGHWPSNWQEGAKAVKTPTNDPLFKKVIATGHHLEWLAIAPEELHPPRESIRKAARWTIDTAIAQKPDEILGFYTFFSHVGGALALWRNTRASEFWHAWERRHPEEGAAPPAAKTKSKAAPAKPAADVH